MTTRISTGTGLALLAGAIVLHAFVSSGHGSLEPAAEAAWTPFPAPASPAPTQAGSVRNAIAAQAAQPQAGAAAHVVAITAVASPSSGSGTVLFRQWSNGNIDRRLVNSTAGLSYQNGWQLLQNPITP